LILSVLLLALALGCSDDGVGPGPGPGTGPPIPVSLAWENPLPQGNDLNSIWGFDDGTVVAVGDAGTIIVWDGNSWAANVTGFRDDLEDVWGPSPDTIYAVGSGGTALRNTDGIWKRVSIGSGRTLFGVHGTDASNLWLVGEGGLVKQWDGTSWRDRSITMTGRLRAVWSHDVADVFVAGTSGQLFHYDGVTWTQVLATGPFPIPFPNGSRTSPDEYVDLHGTGPGTVACLTDRPQAIVFTAISAPGTNWVNSWFLLEGGEGGAIISFGPDDYAAVSRRYSLHVVAGVMDDRVLTGSEDLLMGLWGPSHTDLTAVGQFGAIEHYDGVVWTFTSTGSRSRLQGLNVSSDGSAVAVGWDGTVLRRAPPGAWTSESMSVNYDLAGVWTDATTIVAVGRYIENPGGGVDWRGAIVRDAGAGFAEDVIPNVVRLYDVWGPGSDDLYAVGWAGVILHDDGAGWAVADSGRSSWLAGIHGRSPNDIYAVGAGLMFPQGAIYHFDGTAWSVAEINGVEQCFDVWEAPAGMVFVAADRGRVIVGDAASGWQIVSTGASRDLFAIAGQTSNEVYAAGFGGELLRYDGERWTRLTPNTRHSLRTAAALDDGDMIFAGDGGAILRLRGP
jgi:hypothetical protein